MNKFIVLNIMVFILVFLVVFILQNLNFNRKKIKNKEKVIAEVSYLTKRFKLDMRKIKYKNLLFNISLINSAILAFVFTFVMHINSYVLGMIIAFVILVIVTFASYEILGRHYQRKGSIKNESN